MTNEEYLAGAILIDGEKVMPAVRGILPPGAFQLEAYRSIYMAGLLMVFCSCIGMITITAALLMGSRQPSN